MEPKTRKIEIQPLKFVFHLFIIKKSQNKTIDRWGLPSDYRPWGLVILKEYWYILYCVGKRWLWIIEKMAVSCWKRSPFLWLWNARGKFSIYKRVLRFRWNHRSLTNDHFDFVNFWHICFNVLSYFEVFKRKWLEIAKLCTFIKRTENELVGSNLQTRGFSKTTWTIVCKWL